MFHLQKTIPDWDKPLAAGWRPTVKTIDRGDMLRSAKEHNPGTLTVLRHYYDGRQVFGGTWDDNLGRARAFFRTFIDRTFADNYAPYVDVVEEWNEYIASTHTAQETDERLRWARAAATVWRDDYRSQPAYAHIRLCLCNAAVGNWIDRRFAQLALEFDAILGYHPYTLWQNQQRWDGDWLNLSGLFDVMEDHWGLSPLWLFTECGPFEACETGWRHSACLGGDRDLYVEAVRQWVRDVTTTAAYQQGRILGFALFNSGDPAGRWRHFENTYAELQPLSDMIRREWRPPTPPAAPPTPPAALPASVYVVDGIRYLNLRSGPGVHHPDIGDLPAGAGPFRVLGRDGDWLELAAWAHSRYLTDRR